MKVQDKSVHRSGNLSGKVINMKFDEKGQAKLAHVLVNLYSDGPSAVIREYAANGRDSHVAAGIVRPIEISLPHAQRPEFIVRDFGTGMSLEDIEEIYSKYGGSTKDQSDDFIGSYGLGCKSALSISPSFTINSVKNGEKTVAVISRESGTLGRIDIIVHTSTTEENGVTISIPVQEKYQEFAEKAQNVFLTWAPGTVLIDGRAPAISMYDTDMFYHVTDVCHVSHRGNRWDGAFVNMGGIAYPIDRNQLGVLINMVWTKTQINLDDLLSGQLILTVPIGAVELVPSREAVRWTRTSTSAVVDALIAGANALKASLQERMDRIKDPIEVFSPEMRNIYKTFSGTIRNGGITWKGQSLPMRDISFSDVTRKNEGLELTDYNTGTTFHVRHKGYGSGLNFGLSSTYQHFNDGGSHYIFVDARKSTIPHAEVLKNAINFIDANDIKKARTILNYIRDDIMETNFWLKTVLDAKLDNFTMTTPEEVLEVSKEYRKEKARLARLARKDTTTQYSVIVPTGDKSGEYRHKEITVVMSSIEKHLKDNPTHELFVEDSIYNVSYNEYGNSRDYFLPENAVVIALRGTRTTQAFASRNPDLKFRTDLTTVIAEEVAKRISEIKLEDYFRNAHVDSPTSNFNKAFKVPKGFLRTVIEPLDYFEQRKLSESNLVLHHLKEIRNIEEIKLPKIDNVTKSEKILAEAALLFEGESMWVMEDRSDAFKAQMRKYIQSIAKNVDAIAYS